MLELNSVYNEDCLTGMLKIDDKSVDFIYADLPFGTTLCDFDCRIDLVSLWAQYRRILKDRGAIALHASQPFTSILLCSNIKEFRHEWIWKKSRSGSSLGAKHGPIKRHESILVFGPKPVHYYPVMQPGKAYSRQGYAINKNNHRLGVKEVNVVNTGTRFPISVLDIKHDWRPQQQVHPTQKPVELAEWFVRTYSKPGDLVLDSCAGSGTTGIACKQLNRNFIGFELDSAYWALAVDRINSARVDGSSSPV